MRYVRDVSSGQVRGALSIDDLSLAERLLAGVEPRHPYNEHALTAAHAALAEHHGDHTAAADAATRWEQFGVVPELAHALLGQGRCLLALGRTTSATAVLQQARVIFDDLHATPALGEIDRLLGDATALSS